MGRVLVALDSFKGSLDAATATAALARGLRRHRSRPEVLEHPVADGGEGTLDAFEAAGFERVPVRVRGPVGGEVITGFAHRDGIAVVESADASGLGRLPGPPSRETAVAASTCGTGQVIAAALDAGHREVVVGLGGSASTDGGAGLLAALTGRDPELPRSAELAGLHARLRGPDAARLVVACDVDNPLCGPHGAAAVYGPQKGADAALVAELDRDLREWARELAAATGRAVADSPGAGAAGGAGFALLALGGRRAAGIELVLDLTGLADRLAGADLVVTGEGALDRQTLRGKAPAGVARAARDAGVPIVAAAGRNRLSTPDLAAAGFAAAFALADLEPDPARCMRDAAPLLERLGARIAERLLPRG
ncbi:glycerate kinase [Saccharopolyspora gregorii]|uniref:glycerate kinase n=1 Tax=Saccharopolyspora gregorii TaxID=33914 RepID=UPI0021AC46F7|nr:glycerate kinase [Saccharopolyspora gregorii]